MKRHEPDCNCVGCQVRATAKEKQRGTDVPARAQLAMMGSAAELVILGKTIRAAAAAVNTKARYLEYLKENWPAHWKAALESARQKLTKAGIEIAATPRGRPRDPKRLEAVRDKIQRAAALFATGLTWPEIARDMGLRIAGVRDWQRLYPKLWEEEYKRAMETQIVLIRKQAGTDKVLEDPESYLRGALRCEQWAGKNGHGALCRRRRSDLGKLF